MDRLKPRNSVPPSAFAWIGLIFTILVGPPLFAAEQATALELGPSNDTHRWPYDLPFLADEALKWGYELPLPRGMSVLYYYVQRDIEISDVRAGINGAPLRNVSNFVNLGSKSHVNVVVARFDAWLLPFVDVYGLAGSVWNNTTTKGTLSVPTPALKSVSQSQRFGDDRFEWLRRGSRSHCGSGLPILISAR
jgi:hypothetical protein